MHRGSPQGLPAELLDQSVTTASKNMKIEKNDRSSNPRPVAAPADRPAVVSAGAKSIRSPDQKSKGIFKSDQSNSGANSAHHGRGQWLRLGHGSPTGDCRSFRHLD